MTEKLYYSDSHISTFTAKVLSCEETKKGYAIILDRTAFFPTGGGQLSDTGVIGDALVSSVIEADGEIIHFVDKPLVIGAIVSGTIDYELRFSRMQNHSGEHIVSGLVHKLYGYDNVGFHLGDGDMTVDFNGELSASQLDNIEKLANRAVFENRSVISHFPSAEELPSISYRSKLELTENVRLIEIEGIDMCACCAPHVSKTGEIGIIKILDHIRYKGGVRIHMLCGYSALNDYKQRYSETVKISHLLSVKQHDIASAVTELQNDNELLKYRCVELRRASIKKDIDTLSQKKDIIFSIEESCSSDDLRFAVNYAFERLSGLVAILTPLPDQSGFRYCIGYRTSAQIPSFDLKGFATLLNSKLSGKGGGSNEMIQGTLLCSAEDVKAFFDQLL